MLKSLHAAHGYLPAALQHPQNFHRPELHQYGRVSADIRKGRSPEETRPELRRVDPAGYEYLAVVRIGRGSARQSSPLYKQAVSSHSVATRYCEILGTGMGGLTFPAQSRSNASTDPVVV